MIHVALVLLAIFIFWKVGVFALAFVADAFDTSPGCGCLSIILVVVFGVIVFAIAC
jgi:hypothetical protein